MTKNVLRVLGNKLSMILRRGFLEHEYEEEYHTICFICAKEIGDNENFSYDKGHNDFYHVNCGNKN